MTVEKALVLSLALHGGLFFLLQSGFSFIPRPDKRITAIEAKLMFKDKIRAPDLLPRKQPAAKPAENVVQKQEKAAPPPPPPAPAPAPVPVAVPAAAPKPSDKAKPKSSYAGELARLSKSFAAQLESEVKSEEPVQDYEDDGSYFDQIYSLIKKSFVVPPHINGPQGHKLQAVLRLFLSSDGHLARLNLEQSSGDEHFDKAVMDGTRRVNNFGAVPLMLQSALSNDGVIVEMCPFKCAERRGG